MNIKVNDRIFTPMGPGTVTEVDGNIVFYSLDTDSEEAKALGLGLAIEIDSPNLKKLCTTCDMLCQGHDDEVEVPTLPGTYTLRTDLPEAFPSEVLFPAPLPQRPLYDIIFCTAHTPKGLN